MRFVLKHFQNHFETLFSHMLGYIFLKNLCEMVFRYACKHSHTNETRKRNQTIFQLNWPSDHLHFMPFMCWFTYIYIYIYIYRKREREREMYVYSSIYAHLKNGSITPLFYVLFWVKYLYIQDYLDLLFKMLCYF